MKLTIPYHYTEEVIPKRCRKPRPMRFEAAITLTIHEVTGEQAPVAIIQHSQEFTYEEPAQASPSPQGGTQGAGNLVAALAVDVLRPTAPSGEYRAVTTTYRWWRSQLYVRAEFQRYSHAPHETQTASQFSADPYPYTLHQVKYYDYDHYQSKAERQKDFRKWAKSILFIDGERWETSREPRYVVMTFGLGCNHGLGWGTNLTTATAYNSNISRDRYFRVDQFEQAVAETTRIALARGDTKAVPVIETQNPDRFEILIPEAIRLRPAKEHGKGCAFLNQMEGIIERAKDPMTAGILGIVLAIRDPNPRT
jgi:hypothetical protein